MSANYTWVKIYLKRVLLDGERAAGRKSLSLGVYPVYNNVWYVKMLKEVFTELT